MKHVMFPRHLRNHCKLILGIIFLTLLLNATPSTETLSAPLEAQAQNTPELVKSMKDEINEIKRDIEAYKYRIDEAYKQIWGNAHTG